MITFSLQSGSCGNCIYVEAGDVRLLFDAGITGKQTELRLAEHGRSIRDVMGVLITHEHSDHSQGAGVLSRKFGLPVYVTRPTWRAMSEPVGGVKDLRHFQGGGRIEFGDVMVHSIRTPHDAVDGCAFIVEHEGRRLGIMTDLGHPFRALRNLFGELDAAYLESNYDPEMLDNGPYTPELKRRIRGERGHLANHEAGELIRTSRSARLRWVALAHLSEKNNDPDVALATNRAIVGRDLPLHLAGRHKTSELLVV